jgi:nucleoside-diphosphate-sugar epimerase
MNTVLILGANGRFGQAATQAFAAAGWQVLAQVRRAPAAPLPARARALALPLHDTAALAAAAAGAQVVVHAVNPVYTRWDAEAMPALQQGLDLAQHLGALFMLPGNVYNHGSRMPPRLDEQTPQHPDTDKGRMRVAMEAQMAQRAAQGLRSVVIRAGDFYGCGSGSWLDQAVVKDIAKGRLVYPGPLDLPHAWAYLPDLARAFVAVAAQPPAAAFETLHFEGHTLTGRQLLAAVEQAADALGLRPAQGFAVGGMPWGLIRAVGLVYPLWRELGRMRYLWQVPHALDGSRLARSVALPPATPVVAALRQSLIDLGLGAAPARLATPLP